MTQDAQQPQPAKHGHVWLVVGVVLALAVGLTWILSPPSARIPDLWIEVQGAVQRAGSSDIDLAIQHMRETAKAGGYDTQSTLVLELNEGGDFDRTAYAPADAKAIPVHPVLLRWSGTWATTGSDLVLIVTRSEDGALRGPREIRGRLDGEILRWSRGTTFRPASPGEVPGR